MESYNNKMQGQDARQQNLLSAMDNQLTLRATDQIYHQAFQYFRICNWIAFIYASGKAIATPYFIYHEPFSHFTFFLILLLIASLLQVAFYYRTRRVAQSVSLYYDIAEETSHIAYLPQNQLPPNMGNAEYRTSQTYDYTDPQASEDERRMKALSMQIKYHLHNSQEMLSHFNQIQFGVYQIAHIWGLFLLLLYEFPVQSSQTYVTIIVLLGTYQYLQFYIIAAFFIVIIPFYAIKQLYNFLTNRYKAYKLQRVLKSHPYSTSIQGDHECKICLMNYEENDSIIVLKCSELHNFHASCFREWAKNASTCPLCRRDITSN